ncbi:hypothetical protein A0H81_14006 [Grifola frondosa]|uniref:Uncharacterized protein n=1 Tax=Grifola frondosa TaxID=5627 RepID=A0A1C7LMR6_GRIFR|nr:hypothetical protein A0H81_14006 [Grifola frondosa]
MTLIHDLILHLSSLGEEMTDEDQAAIVTLKKYLKGNTGACATRGTLLTMIATMAADQNNAQIQLPKQSKNINLRTLNLYALVFSYLRHLWEHETSLIPDTSAVTTLGEPFIPTATPYSHVVVNGIRYGAATAHRGAGCRYAYIHGRQPVQIDYIFHIAHSRNDPSMRPLETTCAVVRPFVADNYLPVMPWDLRSIDLGIDVWYSECLGARTIVDVRAFSGHFALATVDYRELKLWVSMSFVM